MDILSVNDGSTLYPASLARLGAPPPATLSLLGNPDILNTPKLALFCSKKCSGTLIIRTHDLAHSLRDAGIVVIGGFHSPVEQECLNVLLKGSQPLIICPARTLHDMRIAVAWRKPIEQGRLLLLSSFPKKQRRATADLAQKRNELVAAIADAVFITYAAPGSATESLCRRVLSWNKSVFTFPCTENKNLARIGIVPIKEPPVDPVQAQEFWFRGSTGI